MPINPTPTPPGVTSPVSMPKNGTTEPSGVQLSCIEFTEPLDVSVTEAPQIADDDAPLRTSLPSMFPPLRIGGDRLVGADGCQPRVAVRLREVRQQAAGEPQRGHDRRAPCGPGACP